MPAIFHTEQWVPYPVELVFAFFANPYNLPLLMPKFLKVRIEEAALAPPPPRPVAADPALRLKSIAAGAGSRFIVSACILPLPLINFRVPWEAEITEFQWNHHFTDIQLRGPFQFWKHTHSVEEQTRTNQAGVLIHGTLVTDAIEFTPRPAFAHALVRKQLASSFRSRQKKLDLILPKLVASLNRR
ncbi:SRPBCC family protein [Terriglobus tenax]|uniref:SRPBCC family protein n=1 Tax=Terriglobus tenax TaxID=1111115 RepID=UPI0021E0E4AC|nr:cyclase [Terriglobus tenax]